MTMVIGLAMSTMTGAFAAGNEDYPGLELTAAVTACGEVTMTFTNPYGFPLSANGGFGEPTVERDWSDAIISEGPYAGQPFGLFYAGTDVSEYEGGTIRNLQEGTATKTFSIVEDANGGSINFGYFVKSGSEQTAYILREDITVNTNCEPDVPETKDDCKKGGWEEYGFRNQGQCIRFVNTGQDSR
ncbi:hypothetical protein [Euzebya sp.]|uniref:hypothetical protein n=1 Tax=Euzebya sp. TaxID=1971409 RepID=UPI0035178768